MSRIGAALGWSVMGLIGGAIIGAVAGFVMGIIRIENVLQAAMAGALPVGLIGAAGAFSGSLLGRPSAEDDSLTIITSFGGALLGALLGKVIGVALGADVWLLESMADVENQSVLAFLIYHVELVGGPQVVVGSLVGILTVGAADMFLGEDNALNVLIVAAFLTPVVAIVAALAGQIDWGSAIAIVVGTVAVIYVMMKAGGGSSASGGGGGGKAKG